MRDELTARNAALDELARVSAEMGLYKQRRYAIRFDGDLGRVQWFAGMDDHRATWSRSAGDAVTWADRIEAERWLAQVIRVHYFAASQYQVVPL